MQKCKLELNTLSMLTKLVFYEMSPLGQTQIAGKRNSKQNIGMYLLIYDRLYISVAKL